MPQLECHNRLLASLRSLDFSLIAPYLEPVLLEAHDSLQAPNEPIGSVYFVETGLVAVIASMRPGRSIQIGLVGCEGMTGSGIVQGDDQSPYRTAVLVTGSAERIDVHKFRTVLGQSPTIQAKLNLYARVLAIQVASTALANGNGRFEERLARWLLMTQDRMQNDQLGVTHELLARMLGSSHAIVVVGLRMLEERGAIHVKRNGVAILAREILLETAGGLYGVPEREYERLLGTRSSDASSLH
jgi:CRP-like cAMP-binding protein